MKHGGDLTEAEHRHGVVGQPWLDLSTGINPHPWPIPEGLCMAGWTRLPSAGDLQGLLAAARRAYAVPDGVGITAAPGTQALIQWLPRLARCGPVAVVGPTYGEHAAAWRGAGFAVAEVESLDAVPAATRHVVVVNPNNPDGRIAEPAALRAAAWRCAAEEGWLVVDESFADVVPAASVVAFAAELPVVVLRSFGKFYGLAGARLGFAVAPPAVTERIEAALGPWAVSGPALAVGTAALGDAAWAAAMRDTLAGESLELDAVLTGAGLEIVGGTSLYRLARTAGAGLLHERLARQRIWVRRFAWSDRLLRFGLPPDAASLARLQGALHEARRGR